MATMKRQMEIIAREIAHFHNLGERVPALKHETEPKIETLFRLGHLFGLHRGRLAAMAQAFVDEKEAAK